MRNLSIVKSLRKIAPRNTKDSWQARGRRRHERDLDRRMDQDPQSQQLYTKIKSNPNRGYQREAQLIDAKRKRLLLAESSSHSPPSHGRGGEHIDTLQLFPKDVYRQSRVSRGHCPNFVQLEAYDDIVARIENAYLAGMQIPPHFTSSDLYLAYVPNRRLLAFAYATILPNVLDNFRKALKVAQLPMDTLQLEVYQKMEAMHWLSQFWRERIKARSGVAMLFAEKYAKAGSPQHLKLYAELTGEKPPDTPVSQTQVNINMPYGSTQDQKQLQGQTVDADYTDLEKEPA